ncbi:MAG: hypothetical protein WCA46_19425 [Actinocatenispora sp.]
MPSVWWVVGVVAVVVLVATYLTWLARRVDRLHARAAGASSALDGQLLRRATVITDLADRSADRWSGQAPSIRTAARAAAEAAPPDREAAENDLTRLVRELTLEPDDGALVELGAVGRRVMLARQVHTDLVRDALAVRRRRVVRLLRLARKHPVPGYFDIDDPALPSSAGGGTLARAGSSGSL